jgi:predicted nucleic acid-binding protein
LVLDASVAIRILDSGSQLGPIDEGEVLVGPPLLFSEVPSALRQSVWRGVRSVDETLPLLRELNSERLVERRGHPGLIEAAWEIAERLGWAKTYDAEYVALASLLECRLLTLDSRLRRGADPLGFVVTPAEL